MAITLPDGRAVCTWCEHWRHECEARHIANMTTNEERKRYLGGVSSKRGATAAERLRLDAWVLLKKSAQIQ